ncbi:MAG: GDCCVxC domain-containing (seleno)protein [Polaromonas sp.]|uniref:GDCCVxC domain-containing (seleno)protein n=1 Tax=Polaromonas sp. TaxID=1869339 RepID=UPI00273400F4|nr:GDCCVxC domain-containing (seleno)protein [Polaromonas sp.]MDP2818865.1 GDCCVxC domain-containing (seleno)protein [Polaromonas sp.]
MSLVVLGSTLTCPACAHQKAEQMPTEACQWFYECGQCHALLRPKRGDCCVFCSYGSVPCPPIQQAGRASACCGTG